MHSMERTGHLPRLVANFNIIFGNLIRDFPLSAAFSLSVFFFFFSPSRFFDAPNC